jgi:hypothetical protein
MGKIQELFEKTVLGKEYQANLEGLAQYGAEELRKKSWLNEHVGFGLTRGDVANATDIDPASVDRMSDRMLYDVGTHIQATKRNI